MAEFQLTPQQRAAVETDGATLLVSAAAGSGKTKVLVDRLMRYVCRTDDPCNIDDFLIITYTRAAAAELRSKIASALQKQLVLRPEDRHLQRQMHRIYLAQISTVHAFCADLLRRYAYQLDLPADFRVAEETECADLQTIALEKTLQDAYAHLKEQPAVQCFIDTLGAGRSDRRVGDLILQMYQKANCQLDPARWMDACLAQDDGRADHVTQTRWGQVLMDALSLSLSQARQMLERTLVKLESDAGLLAKYEQTFREDLEQIQRLEAAKDWDAVHQQLPLVFGRMKNAPKDCDPDLKAMAQAARKEAKELLTKGLEVFCIPEQQVMAQQAVCAQGLAGLFQLTRQFAKHFRQEKRQRKWMDFSDLEHEARRLLCRSDGSPTAVAREVSERYRQIMVDEYQDSNRLQDSIFFAISRAGQNVFLVGDVKQSIYRFRLADPTIFLEKYQQYRPCEEAGPGESQKILLSQNFRSRAQILEAANDICRQCMSREVGDVDYNDAEELRFGRIGADPPQTAVELHCISLKYDDDDHPDKRSAEAALVAKRIQQLLQEENYVSEGDSLRRVEPGDIVILLSTLRTVAPAYVKALKRRGIPVSYEQDGDLLDTEEISTVLSLLQILDNPHQDIPLYAAMASPLFGFTADAVAAVRVGRRTGDLYECLVDYSRQDTACAAFLEQLTQLRLLSVQLPVDQLLAEIYRQLDAEAVFGAMDQGAQRVNNLRAFFRLAVDAAQNGSGMLPRFLRQIESRRERGIPAGKDAREGGCVRIMSIHKSKGLEFPVVVLAGLSQRFNAQDLMRPVLLHPELGAASDIVDLNKRVKRPSVSKKAVAALLRKEMISEQMRVLYVALTRARDMLIMTYAEAALLTQLEKMVHLLDILPAAELAGRASRLGHWVLMNAMQRVEAGELFAEVGRPAVLQTEGTPWNIRLHDAEAVLSAMDEAAPAPVLRTWEADRELDADALRRWMNFEYAYKGLDAVPTKITATQLKGRYLDTEVGNGSNTAPNLQFRKAEFHTGPQPLRPAQVGTATHLAMQFVEYAKCTDLEGTQAEIRRLVEQEFLTEEQAQVVSAEKITALFTSDLGRQILSAPSCIREFKFSVLVDAQPYFAQAAGEKVMLQGVTDCCLMDDDGITVIDFKTDRVTEKTQMSSAEYYRGQLNAYAAALEQIFAKPVKKKLLYFFATNQAVEV